MRIQTVILTVAALALWTVGCGANDQVADDDNKTEEKTAAATDSQSPKVTKVAFVDVDDICGCSKNRFNSLWRMLSTTLQDHDHITLERVHEDKDPEKAQLYKDISPFQAHPAIYFLDDKDSLVEMVQGMISKDQILQIIGADS